MKFTKKQLKYMLTLLKVSFFRQLKEQSNNSFKIIGFYLYPKRLFMSVELLLSRAYLIRRCKMSEQIICQVAYVVDKTDNVGTAITDILPGIVELRGAITGVTKAVEPISFGHKIALEDIEAGNPVIKFGYVIGTASQQISKGRLAHMHNIHSRLDKRSNEFEEQKEAECKDEYTLYRGSEPIC